METSVKNQIKKLVKNNGSHFGVVKHIITSANQNIDFDLYKDFTIDLFNKKYKNVESKIRANIRYQ